MKLPQMPQGVVEAAAGMLPDGAKNNPYQNISWIWQHIVYGVNKAAVTRAMMFGAAKAIQVLTQGMLEARLQVPAEDGKTAWSAASTIEGNRLKMVRKGAKTPLRA